jgi:hypothetical protein
MAERKWVWAVTGTGAKDRELLSPDEQAKVGYDRGADTDWQEIVDKQPGETWGARLRSAIQLTLEPYDYDVDKAKRELRDAGKSGLIRFAPDGTPIGGRALAGALRASAKHPRMHRMWTQSEMTEENLKTGGAKRTRRTISASERALREEQAAKRKQAREILQRTGGGSDLRRRPTAGKTRAADLRSRGVARRESFRRAAREAATARSRASAAAVAAGA